MDLICNICRETKPEELFVKRERSKPFSQSNVRCCRECNCHRNRARYKDPAVRTRQLRANAQWRMAHPERQRLHEKQFATNRPAQQRARNRVAHLLRRGHWARQPCVVCGSELTEAHHDSYAQPHWDVVRWLCKDHHERWHQMLDPVKRELLAEPMVDVARLRDQATEVQKQITALRDRFRELSRKADALELENWNKVMEAAEPMFQDFLKAS